MRLPSSSAVGIGVIIVMLLVGGIILFKFSKAAVYTCYYGEASQGTGYNGYSGSLPVHRPDGIDNLRCYKNVSLPQCGPGYDRMSFKGVFYMSEAEFANINRDSIFKPS